MSTILVITILFAGFVRAGSSTNAKNAAHMVGGVRGYGAAPQTPEGNRLASVGDQAGTTAAGQRGKSTNDVTYWRSLAQKRLRLLGRREHRIVALLVTVHKLRGESLSRTNASGSPRSIPHRSGWLCIHRYEGSWTDAGDPYWGGLQMDRTFMETYAPRWLLARGWANTWTPDEQMMVAERAYRVRGFEPWPTTARDCGLL